MNLILLLFFAVIMPQGTGVSTAWQRSDEWQKTFLEMVRPTMWMNWVHDNLDDPTYVPMAFSFNSYYHGEYVQAAQEGTPRVWLLGNEPELLGSRGEPEDAATLTHRWQEEVKLPFACCGTIVVYYWPDSTLWLDRYLAAGGVTPDYWHIHIYFVSTGAEWDASLDLFREWMETNGVVRPIVVSETTFTNGSGMFPGMAEVYSANLLTHIHQAVVDKQVHAAFWYSDNDYWDIWDWSNLLSDDGSLTLLGHLYRNLLQPTALLKEPQPLRQWMPLLANMTKKQE